MTKKVADLKQLDKELSDALSLLNDKVDGPKSGRLATGSLPEGSESLLNRCAQISNQSKSEKPLVRVIHHFACSGGTLFSKCIAALPNVFLLSEMHPTTRHGIDWSEAQYTPRDVITQAMFGGVPCVEELASKIFIEDIIKVHEHLDSLGGKLVIRAHSHADYCFEGEVPNVDTVTRLLSPHFELKHLVTVRNPIDAFMSLRQNGWVHFSPDSFDEYCERFRRFLNGFEQAEIVSYEDLVEDPRATVKRCSDLLELDFIEDIFDYLDIFKVSGDSGRSGSKIAPRPRKPITDEYRREIMSSPSFQKLCKQYGFAEQI